jgi:zinc transport system substrate-binding protein
MGKNIKLCDMIIKIIFLLILSSTVIFAKLSIAVSIIPEKIFVEKIGGKFVDVWSMVKKGSSPHSYEPKPSQMRMLARSDVYFSIGVDFELGWLYRFRSINPKLKLVELDKKVKNSNRNINANLRSIDYDPHIWLDPKNVLIMAKAIYDELVLLDKTNASYYDNRYKIFVKEIEYTDSKIKSNLANTSKRVFVALHPSFGHFASRYKLKQLSLGIKNIGIKARQIEKIIRVIKKYNLSHIITSPEFWRDDIESIFSKYGVTMVLLSPLSKEWSNNLIYLSTEVGR